MSLKISYYFKEVELVATSFMWSLSRLFPRTADNSLWNPHATMPDKAQATVLPLPWSTKPYHNYYVQLVFLSSLNNYIWGLFFSLFFMKYAYNTFSLPISHCMDKIISLYHVWGDQWQAKHIAEPTMCLVGTLRILWGQQLVIWLVICKRCMKHSQASRGWSVVYCRKFDGSFHGERCQKQDDLGAHQSCWKQADEIKIVVSIWGHAARIIGKSQ